MYYCFCVCYARLGDVQRIPRFDISRYPAFVSIYPPPFSLMIPTMNPVSGRPGVSKNQVIFNSLIGKNRIGPAPATHNVRLTYAGARNVAGRPMTQGPKVDPTSPLSPDPRERGETRAHRGTPAQALSTNWPSGTGRK